MGQREFIPPTSFEVAIAYPLSRLFNALVCLIPVRWLIRHAGARGALAGSITGDNFASTIEPVQIIADLEALDQQAKELESLPQ